MTERIQPYKQDSNVALTGPLDALKSKCDISQQLADEHWEYVENLLAVHGETEEVTSKIGWHYRTAFVHGFKHAMEITTR